MSTTLIIAICFSIVVFSGSIYFCKRNPFNENGKQTFDIPMSKKNWTITIILTVVAFGIIMLMGLA